MPKNAMLLATMMCLCISLFAKPDTISTTAMGYFQNNERKMFAADFEAGCKVFTREFVEHFQATIARSEDPSVRMDPAGLYSIEQTLHKGNIYLISGYLADDGQMTAALIGLGTFSYMNAAPVIVGVWRPGSMSVGYIDILPMWYAADYPLAIKKDPYLFLMDRTFIAGTFIPMELREQEKELSSEAKIAIMEIRKVYDIYIQTNGAADGYTMVIAVKDARLDERALKNWFFEVVGNPPSKYYATSTRSNPAGEGKQIWYDVRDANFHGYGIDDW